MGENIGSLEGCGIGFRRRCWEPVGLQGNRIGFGPEAYDNYIEDIEKIINITIKSMRQEDAEKDNCKLNYINDEQLKRIMNTIKKGIRAEKTENQLN